MNLTSLWNKALIIGLCSVFFFSSFCNLFAQKQSWNLVGGKDQIISFKDTTPVILKQKLGTWYITNIYADQEGTPLFSLGQSNFQYNLLVEEFVTGKFFQLDLPQTQYYDFTYKDRIVMLNDSIYAGIIQLFRDESFLFKINLKNKRIQSLNLDSLNLKMKSNLSYPVRHADGQKWWNLILEYESNRFGIGLLESDTFKISKIQQIGKPLQDSLYFNTLPFTGDSITWKEEIKALREGDNFFNGEVISSVNGDQIAFLLRSGQLILFDFDRCSGLLSNYREIQKAENYASLKNKTVYTSVVFSPDDSKLYLSREDTLFQLDLKEPNYQKSVLFIEKRPHVSNKENILTWMNPAPDGKIYVWHGLIIGAEIVANDTNSMYFGIVHYPNNKGSSCKYIHSGFYLDGASFDKHGSVLPPPHLGKLDINIVAKAHRYSDTLYTCPTDSVRLGTFSRSNVQYRWSPTNYLNSDTVATPIFIGEKAGMYPYVLKVRGLAGSCWEGETASDTVWVVVRERKDTLCKRVSISPKMATKPDLSIYPNPSQDGYTLFLESDISRTMSIEIHDIMGKMILEQTITLRANDPMEQYLKTDTWVSGIYLCTIRQNGHILNSQKLLLIK